MKVYIDTQPELEWEQIETMHCAEEFEIMEGRDSGHYLLFYNVRAATSHPSLDDAKIEAERRYKEKLEKRFIAIDVPSYLDSDEPERLNYILGYLAGRNKALDEQKERYLNDVHEL